MSIAPPVGNALANALKDAHALVDMGVPVFTCRMNNAGDPYPPKGWEKTQPLRSAVDTWRPGLALCAVTGVVFDVLDIDPRNGGKLSIKRLTADLGNDGPEVFWKVRTPSGGLHLWISPLGIGTRPGFLPGLDLKGGSPDRSSRGFVFLPPTVRPSKDPSTYGERTGYAATVPLSASSGVACEALSRYIEEQSAVLNGSVTSGREDASSLRSAVLNAPAG